MDELKPLKFYVEPVICKIDSSVRGLCTRPYHDHPKGCPNHGQRDTCPPAAPRFHDLYDPRQVWACWTAYDLAGHRERQREAHPDWSERQLVNCRHWQGKVRAFLKRNCQQWIARQKRRLGLNLVLSTCPEAMGVNVTVTMERLGVELEWPPRDTTRVVYLVGVPK
jgi:hypothetical protein